MSRGPFPPAVDHVRVRPPVVLKLDAEALAWVWFRRGLALGAAMALAAVGGVLLAARPAAAGDILISGTRVVLEPSARVGAVAQVVVLNQPLNDGGDDGLYSVAMPGLRVDLVFAWNVGVAGEDAVTVIPPEGLACLPVDCRVVVLERDAGVVTLYPLDGVGM